MTSKPVDLKVKQVVKLQSDDERQRGYWFVTALSRSIHNKSIDKPAARFLISYRAVKRKWGVLFPPIFSHRSYYRRPAQSREYYTAIYINVCVSQEAFHHFFREMSGHFASWKKHLNQNYSISAALSQLRISNLVDKPAFLIYLQNDVNNFKHSSLFYWEKTESWMCI